MQRANTNYHGSHEYSTFSSSTIGSSRPSGNYKNPFCFLCRLPVLHPVGPFRCIWDMFVMLVLIYTSIEIPFTMSFGQSTTISYLGLAVDCFLLMDIFLNFHTAYFDKYDHLRLVTNKKYICKSYFKRWFFIDLITCIPFQFLFDAKHIDHSGSDESGLDYIKFLRVFRLLRIIKILRFLKMLRIFDSFMQRFVIREMVIVMKMIKIMFGMILFAHFAACLWWYVGTITSPSWIDVHGLRKDDLHTFTKYSYAWYWAVVTLFTTGYGDIVATNTIEQWVCSVSILVGTCFFAYFVGTLTVYITEGDKVQSFRSDKLEEAQSFCDKKKLPKELARAILTHIRYHCTYNYVFDESELLSLLPAYLQHDIHSYVAKQFLLQLKLFKNEYLNLSDFVIGLIAVKCKSISCNQSYKLYDIDDMAKEFYIQRTGKSLMYNKKDEIIQKLSRGSVCGEYSSFLFKKRRTKIECETWSEFYSINIDDIRQILDVYYPKSSASKWKAMKHYLRSAYNDNVTHSVEINHCDRMDGFNRPPKSFSQKSISVFFQPTFPEHSACEDSVHLLNLTKIKAKNLKPHRSRSDNHIPIPPATPLSDNEEEEMTLFTPDPATVTMKLKRPHSYEYSAAVHHKYNHVDTVKDTKEEGEKEKQRRTEKQTENAGDTKDTQQSSERRNSKLFDFKAKTKFLIRSNSAVRDSIVVAHAEKHRDSEATVDSTPQGRSATMKELSKGDRSHLELFIAQDKGSGAFDPPSFIHNTFSEERDSECSFFSSFSCSSGDEKKPKQSNSSVKKKTSVVRKGKGGKFRARKGRNSAVSKLKTSNTQSPRGRHVRRGMKRKKSDKTLTKSYDETGPDAPTPNVSIPMTSLEDSSLLAPLKNTPPQDIENDDTYVEQTYTKSMNIRISSAASVVHHDTSHNLHNGNITPLTYMPVIKSDSVCDRGIKRLPGHQLESTFDVD